MVAREFLAGEDEAWDGEEAEWEWAAGGPCG